jgi:hypothetical protein
MFMEGGELVCIACGRSVSVATSTKYISRKAWNSLPERAKLKTLANIEESNGRFPRE